MEGQHPVSFFQEEPFWNTAIVFSHSLGFFQFLLGFFWAPWISLTPPWRMVKKNLQQLKPTLPAPASTAPWRTVTSTAPCSFTLRNCLPFFSKVILTKCNLRSLSAPFLYRTPYFVIVYLNFPRYGILHLFLLLFGFDKLPPIHHWYFYSNLAWNHPHSLDFAGQYSLHWTVFPLKNRWRCLTWE